MGQSLMMSSEFRGGGGRRGSIAVQMAEWMQVELQQRRENEENEEEDDEDVLVPNQDAFVRRSAELTRRPFVFESENTDDGDDEGSSCSARGNGNSSSVLSEEDKAAGGGRASADAAAYNAMPLTNALRLMRDLDDSREHLMTTLQSRVDGIHHRRQRQRPESSPSPPRSPSPTMRQSQPYSLPDEELLEQLQAAIVSNDTGAGAIDDGGGDSEGSVAALFTNDGSETTVQQLSAFGERLKSDLAMLGFDCSGVRESMTQTTHHVRRTKERTTVDFLIRVFLTMLSRDIATPLANRSKSPSPRRGAGRRSPTRVVCAPPPSLRSPEWMDGHVRRAKLISRQRQEKRSFPWPVIEMAQYELFGGTSAAGDVGGGGGAAAALEGGDAPQQQFQQSLPNFDAVVIVSHLPPCADTTEVEKLDLLLRHCLLRCLGSVRSLKIFPMTRCRPAGENGGDSESESGGGGGGGGKEDDGEEEEVAEACAFVEMADPTEADRVAVCLEGFGWGYCPDQRQRSRGINNAPPPHCLQARLFRQWTSKDGRNNNTPPAAFASPPPLGANVDDGDRHVSEDDDLSLEPTLDASFDDNSAASRPKGGKTQRALERQQRRGQPSRTSALRRSDPLVAAAVAVAAMRGPCGEELGALESELHEAIESEQFLLIDELEHRITRGYERAAAAAATCDNDAAGRATQAAAAGNDSADGGAGGRERRASHRRGGERKGSGDSNSSSSSDSDSDGGNAGAAVESGSDDGNHRLVDAAAGGTPPLLPSSQIVSGSGARHAAASRRDRLRRAKRRREHRQHKHAGTGPRVEDTMAAVTRLLWPGRGNGDGTGAEGKSAECGPDEDSSAANDSGEAKHDAWKRCLAVERLRAGGLLRRLRIAEAQWVRLSKETRFAHDRADTNVRRRRAAERRMSEMDVKAKMLQNYFERTEVRAKRIDSLNHDAAAQHERDMVKLAQSESRANASERRCAELETALEEALSDHEKAETRLKQLGIAGEENLESMDESGLCRIETTLLGVVGRVREAREILHRRKQDELERINEEEKGQKLCCICQDAMKSVLLLPCRHLCVCQVCSRRRELDRCPICRVEIDERIDVFA